MDFQYDDGGRVDAGYRGFTGDCVVRAIAIATEKPYAEVYDAMFVGSWHLKLLRERGRSPRDGVSQKIYRKYLALLGWQWHPTMQIGSGCKVHLTVDELPEGRLIVRISKHLVAVVDGVIHDTFDPQHDIHYTHPITPTMPMLSREFTHDGKFAHSIQRRCVYGYWSMKRKPT